MMNTTNERNIEEILASINVKCQCVLDTLKGARPNCKECSEQASCWSDDKQQN